MNIGIPKKVEVWEPLQIPIPFPEKEPSREPVREAEPAHEHEEVEKK